MSTTSPTPPVAAVRPVEHRLHGDVRIDNYYWLRQREDQEVIDFLTAENQYLDAVMSDTKDLQERLYQEMRSYIKERDQSAPVQMGDYYYYDRTEEGKQYSIYCRKQGSLEAAEEILLDLNQLAEGHSYLRLGNFAVSPDQRFLAYALDTSGAEVYTLRVKDLESGELLADEIPGTYYGLVWANDSRTLFYVTQDAAMRPYRVYRHRLGDDPANDALVYQEDEELFFLVLYKAKSRRYIFIHLEGHTTSEIRFLDADDPSAEPQVIQPRIHKMIYSAEHHRSAAGEERFFILTNWEAQNFRLMETPVSAPGQEKWREVIPHRAEVLLDGMECFLDHLALYERENGLRHIRIQDLQTGTAHRVDFKDPVYTVVDREFFSILPLNLTYESRAIRYIYTSLVQPRTVYDYDMMDRSQIVRKEQEVPGYDASKYTSERLWATAADGTQVPISLVHHKELKLDGSNPTLLYGYGSYGASIDPNFVNSRVTLLERGFVFAIAHIRGGSEMGRHWYETGKFLDKRNTFTDFIACAEHVIAQRYTSPQHLVIMGRSAGGLLMGAVTNMRPDLFAGVVAGVPFVDVVTTMLDESIPLTVMEYEEWGNPNDAEYYAYMKSYSPYDNVEAKAYPAILATAGLNDPRVQYWEPAKWVAHLRATKTDDNLLLLKTNMGAGHAGASGRFDYLKETALEFAFMLKVVGRDD
jgi:oligopeptidase B